MVRYSVAFVFVSLFTIDAYATTLRLDAFSTTPATHGDFFVEFDDSNNNMLLELGEVVTFSGITSAGRFFDQLVVVADVPNISSSIGSSGNGSSWVFSNGSLTTFHLPNQFTYELTQVPLPAAVWLFLSAIAGLFGIKRLRT